MFPPASIALQQKHELKIKFKTSYHFVFFFDNSDVKLFNIFKIEK